MTEPTEDAEEPEISALDRRARELAKQDVSRRKLLAASGVGAAAGLSGCSGLGGGGTPTPRVIENERTVIKERTVEVTPEPEPPNYVVTSHVYTTSDIGDFQHVHFGASCAPQYQFVPGQSVGFRVGLWDPETGDQLTNDDVDAVTISFEGPSDIDDLELGWDGDNEEHPSDQWSQRLRNTGDVAPGQYTYTVHVTDEDANYRYVGIWENTFTFLEPSEAPPTVTPTPTEG